MSKLKTYSEFINEGLIDAVKNPIKWKKIKNNSKKFQKAKVAQALNGVDFAKRKEKGKSADLSKDKLEILNQANKAKDAALKDTTSNIGQRMDDLATTPGLKQVVKLAKTKSSMAANQIALKAASGEEAKQLKIKAKALAGKAADAQQALKDYESTDKPEDTAPENDKPAFTNAKDEKDKKEKIAADKADKADAPAETPAETPAADKGKDSTSRPDDGKNSKADIIKRYQDLLDKEEDAESPKAVKLKDKIASLQKESEERFMDPKFVSLLESELLELSNTLNEEIESIDEGMYTADQLTNMLLDDIRKGIRKGIQAPDEKELKTLALKRLKMKRVNKVDIEDTINGWEKSLADARKDKMREKMFSFIKTTKGKIPESFDYVAESVSDKFARLRSNL